MSFLIDPPSLYAGGRVCGGATRGGAVRPRAAGAAAGGILGVFLGLGVATYRNLPWTRPLWLNARDGRDFMINSGVLRIAHERHPAARARLSALAFASYPLWLALGWRHGRRRD